MLDRALGAQPEVAAEADQPGRELALELRELGDLPRLDQLAQPRLDPRADPAQLAHPAGPHQLGDRARARRGSSRPPGGRRAAVYGFASASSSSDANASRRSAIARCPRQRSKERKRSEASDGVVMVDFVVVGRFRSRNGGTTAAALAIAVTGAVLALPVSAQGAVPFKDISTSGPLTHVYVGNELSCQVAYAGDPRFEFYPSAVAPGDCGTMVAVGGALYTPDFSNHDTPRAPRPSGCALPSRRSRRAT